MRALIGRGSLATVLLVAVVGSVPAACKGARSRPAAGTPHSDSAFVAMQSRGEMVMTVDQYTSRHIFEDLPDGGRIVLDRDAGSDTAGITRIREHMRGIAASFEAGDFTKPFQVHAEAVLGASEMAARRSRISYQEVDRPRGAEVRIRSTDSAAIAAVHEFLAYQRRAHHAPGHEGTMGPR
jgi:hypothetical protein